MTVEVRHPWREGMQGVRFQPCGRCGKAKSNPIHRLTARCSVCWKIVKPYELDGAKRCDDCQP